MELFQATTSISGLTILLEPQVQLSLVRRTFTGTKNVGPGPTYDYNTIQAAISAAVDGDIINVAAGTYAEVGQIVINKDLSIVGENKLTTIINPTANTGSVAMQEVVVSESWF